MTGPDPSAALQGALRQDRGRLLAALIRELRDFQLAEDSLQDAAEAALRHWTRTGPPDAPAAWLLRVARRKAIDRLRRDARFRARAPDIALLAKADQAAADTPPPDIPDERLRLIFTCCHPALEEKSRVALTLRSLGGLTTEEIAAAFLDKPATMGQRLSRAKAKIAGAGIPYRVPEPEDLPDRLSGVLQVIYLIFNEGYRANSGAALIRTDLCAEALHLGRVMVALMPREPEPRGLLALMLLNHARSAARMDREGGFVPLDRQDRGLWDRAAIAEAGALLRGLPLSGPYQVQAAISAVHGTSPDWAATDWPRIAALYAHLQGMAPNPVVQINQAVALGYAGQPDRAAAVLAKVAPLPGMADYQPFFVARAEIRLQSGDRAGCRADLDRAIALSTSDAEKRFLAGKRDAT